MEFQSHNIASAISPESDCHIFHSVSAFRTVYREHRVVQRNFVGFLFRIIFMSKSPEHIDTFGYGERLCRAPENLVQAACRETVLLCTVKAVSLYAEMFSEGSEIVMPVSKFRVQLPRPVESIHV